MWKEEKMDGFQAVGTGGFPGGKPKKLKKNHFFSIFHWNFAWSGVILLALNALICLDLSGVEERRKIPKPAWQLEKELADLKQKSEKKLADLSNERDRLKAEVKTLQDENLLIRKELIETLEKYSMLAEKLKRLERIRHVVTPRGSAGTAV